MGFNSKGSGALAGKTWFVNSGIVESALDIHAPEAMNTPKEGEVGVVLHLKNPNGTPQTLYVTGLPRGNENPQHPWARAFNVRNLLELAEEFEVVEGVITPETLGRLVGKEVFYVRYLTTDKDDNGKSKYRTFRGVRGTREQVERDFMRDVSGNNVYKFIGLESPAV